MKDYIFADAVAQALQADKRADFLVQRVTSPEEVLKYSAICDPYAVLMEVNGYPPYTLEKRLDFRDTIKKQNPDCKIVLVVDENSEPELAEQVRQAKKDGRIDQLIYGSISANYLVALMDTL
jgi:DNA-binding NarL/FixJ family response regulator